MKKLNLESIPALYVGIGVLFALVRLLSERAYLFLYDTRPWYQRIFGDLDYIALLVSIFTWPRYPYILITQGTDAFLRALLPVWF